MPSRSLRVAVIGAGAAGLVAARELRREGHAPVVFERTDGVGGTWVYEDADADASASTDPLRSRRSNLYASLRTNLPRECMGFLDFPFAAAAAGPDDDPRRFPGHAEVLRYLREFARRFDLLGLVRFQTEVVRVSREASESWRVRYSKKEAGSEKREPEEEVFDAVVVCNGHYYQTRVADIAGLEAWPGKQLHSNSYRVPEPFHGQAVVLIGCSVSGMDISRDIAGVAKEVHVVDRSAPAATYQRLPGDHTNLWIHSMVDRAEQDGSVVFQDGSRVKADVIIHCTGYKYSFPFLGDDSTISVDDNRVGPLYKHVFPPRVAPQLSFIGLPLKVIPFTLFELQSSWVAGVLSGRIELPSEEEMARDVMALYADLAARGWPRRYTHDLRDDEFEYEDWLAGQCRRDKIEDWRKEMLDATLEDSAELHGSHRDMWDSGDRDHSFRVIPFALFELQSNWVAGVLSGRIELPSEEEMTREVMAFYSDLDACGWPRRYTHVLGDFEFKYEEWLAGQCRREKIEDWRKEMYAAAVKDNMDHHGSYRDMWDDGYRDHLLVQANRDFALYFPAALQP